MNEEPKSIWKKSWTGGRSRLVWFAVVTAATFVVFFCLGLATGLETRMGKLTMFALLFAAGLTLAAGLLVAFIRWLCCWKNFRRFLFGLACFITLIALVYAEEDWRGRHDWEKFKRQWEAKGEKFTFKDFIPPPVPDDQNFAMAPIWVESIESEFGTNVAKRWYGKDLTEAQRAKLSDPLNLTVGYEKDWCDWPTNGNWAKATETDLADWQAYYRALAAKTNLFPVPARPQSPAADVLFALSKYDSAVAALRQASLRPYSRFPIYTNPDNPFDFLLPHLTIFKRCSVFLELHALAELQDGQSEKAAEDVTLALQLMGKIRDEPILISQLVRIAMLQITLQPVYEGLAEHRWSDAQLVELDSELAKLDFLADYQFSMRGERAGTLTFIDFLRRAKNYRTWAENVGSGYNRNSLNLVARIVFHLIPSAFFYQNELTIARMNQEWTLPMASPETQTVSPALVRKDAAAAAKDLQQHPWPYKIFARMLFPPMSRAVEKFAYAQSSVNLARVAIALERYRLAHGEYPTTPDVLAPQFIEKVPHDVIGGGPLHYRLTGDGQFVLYSVGWNERDDGGVVVLDKKFGTVHQNEGDWVWRYPRK